MLFEFVQKVASYVATRSSYVVVRKQRTISLGDASCHATPNCRPARRRPSPGAPRAANSKRSGWPPLCPWLCPRIFRMRPRATVALSTALALCVLISAQTLLFVQSAIDDQSHCTTANDCTEEDKHATLPPHHHRETMSNADKFIELANGEFPEGALPGQQEYEHPLVKRYV